MFWIIYLGVNSTNDDIIRNIIKNVYFFAVLNRKNIDCFEKMRYIVHTGGGYYDLQTDVC